MTADERAKRVVIDHCLHDGGGWRHPEVCTQAVAAAIRDAERAAEARGVIVGLQTAAKLIDDAFADWAPERGLPQPRGVAASIRAIAIQYRQRNQQVSPLPRPPAA